MAFCFSASLQLSTRRRHQHDDIGVQSQVCVPGIMLRRPCCDGVFNWICFRVDGIESLIEFGGIFLALRFVQRYYNYYSGIYSGIIRNFPNSIVETIYGQLQLFN